MQPKSENPIQNKISPTEDIPPLSLIQEELLALCQLGEKLRLRIYKNLLKLLVWKVEMSHLVVLIVSLGLFYRGILFVDHVSSLKDMRFSVISEASAEATIPKEDPKIEKKAETIKTETKESPKEELGKDEMDPLLLDENQIKVLLALAKKGKNIKESEQEADVEKQKKIVELAQENLNKRIEELEKVKKGIEAKKDDLTKDEKLNVTNMAKIYETMKPSQAAEILNKLELTSVIQIIKHMNQKKAAAVVSIMEPKKARQLTFEILKSKDVEEKNSPVAEVSQAASANAPPTSAQTPLPVPTASPGASANTAPAPNAAPVVYPVSAPVPETKSPAEALPMVAPAPESKSPKDTGSKDSAPPVSKT